MNVGRKSVDQRNHSPHQTYQNFLAKKLGTDLGEVNFLFRGRSQYIEIALLKRTCYWSHHLHKKYFTSSLTVSDNRPQYSSERVFQNSWEKINVDSSPLYPQAMGRLNVQWKLIKVCWRRRWPIPGVVIIQSRTLADRIEPVGTACGLQPQSFENNSSLKFQTVHLSMRETSSKHRDIREYLTCVTQLGSFQS